MKAIAWKELRQNLPWATLALLIAGISMLMALGAQRGDYFDPSEGVSICSSGFLLLTTLGSALWGLVVGLLLTIPDLNRDRRSFILHRPSSWTTLFLGKIFAAFALALIPIGVPFLLAALWAATPGSVAAPFDWRMTAAGVADILTGFVFALAGMLAGLRPARWYGSRGLGILAAVLCSFIVHSVDSFGQALMVILGFSLTLMVATWGSFLTGGAYSGQPRVAKLALGICVLLGLEVGMVGAVVSSAFLGLERNISKQYFIDKKGRILITHQSFASPGPERVTDLKGETITEYGDWQAWLNGMLQGVSLLPAKHPWPRDGYRGSSRFMVPLHDSTQGDVVWYYVPSRGLGFGYNRKNRRWVETFGPGGFAPADRPNTSFAEPVLSSGVYTGLLVFPSDVFLPDFQGRTITRLFHSAARNVQCGGVGSVNPAQRAGPLQFVAAIAGNRLHIVRMDGTPLLETELAHDPAQYDRVGVFLTEIEGKRLIRYSPSYELTAETRARLPDFVEEYSSRGDRIATHTLPPLETLPALPVNASAVFGTSLLPPLLVASLPLLQGGLDAIGPYSFVGWLMRSGVVALACAGLCCWVCRRYAFSPSAIWGWVILVLLLGPLGLATLAALQDWPGRVPCDACGKRRVVTRDTCEHCGARFSPPERLGIEILETGEEGSRAPSM